MDLRLLVKSATTESVARRSRTISQQRRRRIESGFHADTSGWGALGACRYDPVP
jgi:hypothetical protein